MFSTVNMHDVRVKVDYKSTFLRLGLSSLHSKDSYHVYSYYRVLTLRSRSKLLTQIKTGMVKLSDPRDLRANLMFELVQ